MVKYDENFLVKYSKEICVNPKLPFKLQKRELLEKLGFPIDDNLILAPGEMEKVKKVFHEYSNRVPFLIGIHLKPMASSFTPFFLIETLEKIKFRDECGKIQFVSQQEMFREIERLANQNYWIEFVKSIWHPGTIAGRLLYFSPARQLFEIQKGVAPHDLGNNREKFPYLALELSFFGSKTPFPSTPFKREEVERIVNSLRRHKYSFEKLHRIAKLPTLEFGYTPERKLIVTDIDWPAQYLQYQHYMFYKA